MTSQAFEEFFDAFSRCPVTRLAREAGAYSTDDPDTWLKAAAARNQPKKVDVPSPLPLALQLLLKLQQPDGRWVDAATVRRIIGVNSRYSGDAVRDATEHAPSANAQDIAVAEAATKEFENHWKWTTALAIAYIRNNLEFFEHTIDAHDKAVEWMTITDTKLMQNAQAEVSVRSDVPLEAFHQLMEQWKKEAIAVAEAQLESALSTDPPSDPVSTAAKAVYVARKWGNTPATVASELLRTLIEYEQHVAHIRRIADDCIRRWRTARLLDERYKAFDTLTAAFNTFTDSDVTGRCHASHLHHVCEVYAEWQQRVLEENQRREAEELVTAATTERIYQTPKFLFDGQDVINYLMHSLDFLSQRRELVDWYGTEFSLVGNPYMVACGTPRLFAIFEKSGDDILDSVQLKPWHLLSDMIRQLRDKTRIYWPQYPPCEDESIMKQMASTLEVLQNGLR